MSHAPYSLNADTLAAVRAVVEEKMRNRECFFALDATNEVKQRGYKSVPPSNFGSHRDMAPAVQDHAQEQALLHGYAWSSLDVDDGNKTAYLYFPDGTNASTLQSHVDRRVTPLIPVEVWAKQVSLQGSGVQSQAVLPTPAPAAVAPSLATVMSNLTQLAAPAKPTLGAHIRRLLGK